MPLPDISLAQFNRIASGKYNAGLVDFATDKNGNVTGELAKVNNHVHKTGKNTVVLDQQRILDVKEAFVKALSGAGVDAGKIAEIRAKLGIPEETSLTAGRADRRALINARFQPLSRQQVRELLDAYARQGRGNTVESGLAVSFEDAAAALATSSMSKSKAARRDAVNAQVATSRKGSLRYAVGDAFAMLGASSRLSDICDVVGSRCKGANAVNERKAVETAVKNQFMNFFQQALKLVDSNESAEFTLFGMKAKLSKGPDGRVTATLGEGAMQQRLSLGKTAMELVQTLIGRVISDTGTLGADNAKLLLDKVFERDTEGFLTGEDRSSLTRQFACAILMTKVAGPEGMAVDYNGLMSGPYNTGTLVEVADLALEGKVATKDDLDRLHDELAKNNAGLDDEMKAMLARVAGMPIAKGKDYFNREAEMQVQQPIVADLGEIANAEIPKAPVVAPLPTVPRPELHQTAETVKAFVADFVFSDDTMVSDVVVDRPGETTRKILASDDGKIAALAKIIQSPEILDAAVAPAVAGAVKEGFATMAQVLDGAWRASHDGETLAAAAAKPDFLSRFSLFLRDDHALPGRELAKFDSIVQNMANKGCAALQGFINKVFKIDAAAARNAQGGITVEPYKDLSPEQVKAAVDAKSLNQILNDAASDSASPGQVALFKQVLGDYFVNMASSADKRSAFAAALRYADTFDFAGLEGEAFDSAKNAALSKFTGAILKGTSPLLQKMMQGLPRTVLGEFADALDDMKSRLAPIPRKIVQAHLMKMVDDSQGKIKSIALKKSLGAASVGEAFLCEFTYVENGQEKHEDMVVKIMRHDAEARVLREADIFTAAAAKIGPGMLKTWQGQLAQYLTEFDFRNEAKNVNVGVELYDVSGNRDNRHRSVAPDVTSMKISPLVAPTKNAMVCTLASGQTADALFAEKRQRIQEALDPTFERNPATGKLKWDAGTKRPFFKKPVGLATAGEAALFLTTEYEQIHIAQKRLQQAASAWFGEALLGSGKFHGDAHAGNLMLSLGTLGKVTFIDFGNLYELKVHYELDGEGNRVMETVRQENDDGEMVDVQRPKVILDERVELLRLILGATMRDKGFFLKGFERLLSKDGKAAFAANRAKVDAILDSVLAKGEFSFDVCYRLQGALVELQKLGLELPPQINCFVQSLTRFQNTIAEMNTILSQSLDAMEAVKAGPGLANVPEPPDPLDPMGEILRLQSSPAGQEMVPCPDVDDIDDGIPAEVPAYLAKLIEDGSQVGGFVERYKPQVADAIRNAADKPAEVDRIVALIARHFNTTNHAEKLESFRKMSDDFRKAWNAAPDDAARNRLIDDFTTRFAFDVRRSISMARNSFQYLYTDPHPKPDSFAKVVMGALFTGAAAAEKMFDENFTAADTGKLIVDATSIATKELHVSAGKLALAALPWHDGPRPSQIVLEAIIKDTESMGGDKSYQIEIGI